MTDVNVCQLLAQAITGISYVAITTNDAPATRSCIGAGWLGTERGAFGGPQASCGTLTVAKSIIASSQSEYELYHCLPLDCLAATVIIEANGGIAGVATNDRHDGNRHRATAATRPRSCETALNNYLPRTGGVLTGPVG